MRFPNRAFTKARYSFGQTSLRTSTRWPDPLGACARCVSANALSASPLAVQETRASSGSQLLPHASHTRSYSGISEYDTENGRTLRVLGRILRVDLTKGMTSVEEMDEATFRRRPG